MCTSGGREDDRVEKVEWGNGGYEILALRELFEAIPVSADSNRGVLELLHCRRVRLTGRVAWFDVAARRCLLDETVRCSNHSSAGLLQAFLVDLSMTDTPVDLSCDDTVQV